MVDFLAVGAHPDDVEIGMGGTVAALVRQGKSVAVLDLTNGEPTPHGTPETRMKERDNATAALGLEMRITLDLKNRELMDTQEARVKVAQVFRELRPNVLFLPYPEDAHPDHVQASQLTRSARFVAKYTKTEMKGEPFYPPRIFFYICMHQKKQVVPSFVFDISETLPVKLEALRAYESQFFAASRERGEGILARMKTFAHYHGHFVGVSYGEPFVHAEEIGIRSFDQFFP